MTWDYAKDIILDSLKDSALVLLFVFIFHVILSYIDLKISNFLVKKKKSAPLFGSLFGLIPQCGTSVLGADLYLKKYISLGTLISIFISCSDEALLMLVEKGIAEQNRLSLYSIPLIGVKLLLGFIVGLIVDLIYRKQELIKVEKVVEEEKCSHHINEKENTKLHKHLIHPLTHSLEIFIYVLIVNLLLGFIIGFIGEDTFSNFILGSKYLAPLFTSIIGLIPNCASSVLITELFTSGNLSFGALLGGLIVNSGLGMMVLLKNRKNIKKSLLFLLIVFLVGLITSYLTCLIFGFDVAPVWR